jgi:8-oxo-dGTP pyrophosphatase MutT (NUDIX family)
MLPPFQAVPLRDFRRFWSLAIDPDGQFTLNPSAIRMQHGALCWRLDRGSVEVLLISSRDSGRWIIPKGWPIEGLSPSQTALQEAWEEAGVTGDADPLSLGQYHYLKVMGPDRTIPCLVSVFGVRVVRLRARFPERKERRRKWYPLEKAAAKVEEPALRDILAGFAPPPAGLAPPGPAGQTS